MDQPPLRGTDVQQSIETHIQEHESPKPGSQLASICDTVHAKEDVPVLPFKPLRTVNKLSVNLTSFRAP